MKETEKNIGNDKKDEAMHKMGRQSAQMPRPVYIRESASIVGQKESKGPLGELFDMVGEDEMFGCKTWEEAESTLQKEAVLLLLGKAKEKKEKALEQEIKDYEDSFVPQYIGWHSIIEFRAENLFGGRQIYKADVYFNDELTKCLDWFVEAE